MNNRTCVGCRVSQDRLNLVRIRLGARGLSVELKDGRGAWLCRNYERCLELASRNKGFDRAFRTQVPRTWLDALRSELDGMVKV